MGGGEVDGGRWFEPIAAHLGAAYLRYSFTKGTTNEVDFLIDTLGLGPGDRVLDAGCGPGRHVHALRARGIDAVGLDLSARFCALTRPAPVVRADVRAVPTRPAFDAVISLCQGGFGLLGGPGGVLDADASVIAEFASVLRPGGRLALSAFSSYFQVRYQADEGDFDVHRGVMHEHTSVKDETGADAAVEMWTTGFTPRELRLAATAAGLAVDAVHGVEPGDYAAHVPGLDHPEFLLLATKPA